MQEHFLSRVLPSLPAPDLFGTAPVYFSLGLSKNKGQYPDQKACSSLFSIMQYCASAVAAGYDSYFALASFKDVLAGRKQANVHEIKSFWADIDAGKPNSKYRDWKEALAAVRDFQIATGLKATFIVFSGRGLHVYWTLTKALTPELWRPIARLFHKLCGQYGLDVDPARAEDPASVLRIPGSRHTSSGNPVVVLREEPFDYDPKEFLRLIGASLKEDAVAAPIAPTHTPQTKAADPLAVALGMGPQPPSAKALPIIQGCPAVRVMGLASYPHWFAGMSVLRRCVDGLEWAHKLSAFDAARYTPEDTERKFYAAAQDAPALCSTFERMNPELCQSCKYRGQVKSPVQLHRLAVNAASAPVASPQATAVPVPPQATKEPTVLPMPAPQANVEAVSAPQFMTAAQVATMVDAVAGHGTHLRFPETWEHPRLTLNHPNFKVDTRGMIHVVAEKDETTGAYVYKEHVICKTQLYYLYSVYERVDDKPKRNFMFELVHPNGQIEIVKFCPDVDHGEQNIMKWMFNARMFPVHTGYTGKLFMSFINAYLQQVVFDVEELYTFQKFGWNKCIDQSTRQETTGFVVGKGVVTASGLHAVNHAKGAQKIADNELKVKGNLENWKRVPQMYRILRQPAGQLAMCFSLAAPFMKYGSGEARSAIYSLWSSEPGLGKSQVLRAAASVWGDPMEQFVARDTSTVARTRRMTILNNLPVFFDELTDMKPEDMYSLAYTLVACKEKEKLKSSGQEFVDTGSWTTVSFATSNRSFKEAIALHAGDSDASLQRVMEYECDFPSYAHMPKVQAYINACIDECKNNYGVAGPEFMYQVLQRPERLATLTKQVEHWCSAHGFENAERFMGYPLAIALKVARWAVEFGLLDYDIDALERWVLEVFVPHNRKRTKQHAPDFEGSIRDYLADRQLHTLTVVAEDRPPHMADPHFKGVGDKYVINLPPKEIYVRAIQDEGVVFISKSDFTAWCRLRHMSPSVIISKLQASGLGVKEVVRNLGRGLSYLSMPRVRCYMLEANTVAALGYSFATTQEQPIEKVE